MSIDTENATEALLETTTGKKPGKASTKPKKGKAAPAPEVEKAPDLIIATAQEIENLSKEEAYEQIPTLTDSVDFSYFRLGGVLAVIQGKESWWKDDGYETFRAFIEDRFGLHYRKAMYLIGIYGALVESGVEWEKLSGIGWSKVKEIADIITVENVDEWVEKAKSMTVLQLQEAGKAAKTGSLLKSDETPGATTGVTTLTFKVHPDQKETITSAVEKAKKEADTEFPGVALEAICLNYLSGAKVAKPKSLKAIIKGYTYEEVLQAFAEVFPDIDVSVNI